MPEIVKKSRLLSPAGTDIKSCDICNKHNMSHVVYIGHCKTNHHKHNESNNFKKSNIEMPDIVKKARLLPSTGTDIKSCDICNKYNMTHAVYIEHCKTDQHKLNETNNIKLTKFVKGANQTKNSAPHDRTPSAKPSKIKPPQIPNCTYICDDCELKFVDASSLEMHTYSPNHKATVAKKSSIICQNCGTTIRTTEEFQLHQCQPIQTNAPPSSPDPHWPTTPKTKETPNSNKDNFVETPWKVNKSKEKPIVQITTRTGNKSCDICKINNISLAAFFEHCLTEEHKINERKDLEKSSIICQNCAATFGTTEEFKLHQCPAIQTNAPPSSHDPHWPTTPMTKETPNSNKNNFVETPWKVNKSKKNSIVQIPPSTGNKSCDICKINNISMAAFFEHCQTEKHKINERKDLELNNAVSGAQMLKSNIVEQSEKVNTSKEISSVQPPNRMGNESCEICEMTDMSITAFFEHCKTEEHKIREWNVLHETEAVSAAEKLMKTSIICQNCAAKFETSKEYMLHQCQPIQTNAPPSSHNPHWPTITKTKETPNSNKLNNAVSGAQRLKSNIVEKQGKLNMFKEISSVQPPTHIGNESCEICEITDMSLTAFFDHCQTEEHKIKEWKALQF